MEIVAEAAMGAFVESTHGCRQRRLESGPAERPSEILHSSLPAPWMSTNGKFQAPPDLVVKSQVIDIVEVI